MRLFFVYIIPFYQLVGSIDAQICAQNVTIDTQLQCTRCTGDLQMDFRPYRRAYYFQNSKTREINCTVNKPANISIYLHYLYKPFTSKPLELSTTKTVSGITLHKLNRGCTYTIRFPEPSSSLTICTIGKYTCKAVTDTNQTISKSQRVEGDYSLGVHPFTLEVEDTELQRTKELIIGTSANLSCSFATRRWSLLGPFILYWMLSDNGVPTQVLDTSDTPRRFETQGRHDKTRHSNYYVATRRLFLRRIGEDANRTFLCRVSPSHRPDCYIERKLRLKTRPCKFGHYCNQNSSKELPCQEGTFSNITGLFSKSGCRTCPLNTYCPLGSRLPIPCPTSSFFPSRRTTIKIFHGKRNEDECRICPVDPCDEVAEHCTFICGDVRFKGVLGRTVSIHCLLSDGTLMRNLSWYKDNKTIIQNPSYKIHHGAKDFVLTIQKMSRMDSGVYLCAGFDTVMGNRFNSTVTLDITDSDKTSNNVLAVALSLSLVILLVPLIGFLVCRCWRRYTYHLGSKDGRMAIFNEIETLPISETFQPDLRTVLVGNTERYDVFICYSSADKIWVRKTLLPTLKDVNLRVCIDFEDFNVGSFIIENVADAIFSSRKTLAVLSPDFICSAWCQKELMMALTRVRDRHKVIPVMYRSCEVPLFLRDVTYLDWCNEDVRHTFWDQLIRTIDDKTEVEMDNAACSVDEEDGNLTTDI